MELTFSQLCSQEQSCFTLLRERIDVCAVVGRSYELPRCKLPWGCFPEKASLGFCRDSDGAYVIYLFPPVSYSGPDPALRDFFHRNPKRFDEFSQLADFMRRLHPSEDYPLPLPELESELKGVVLGQDNAVEAVSLLLRGHVCKLNPQRPLSLIFYGPTGVGKSQLGKALSGVLNRCMGMELYDTVWTELNTFSQAHSVYRLTGAPPGYVGYDDRPVFEAVLDNPNTVFMFDELEKAHPDVLKVFMSALDEGRCAARRKGPRGERELDFRHCIFVFTTNADLSKAEPANLGFAPSDTGDEDTAPSPDAPSVPDAALRLFRENEIARNAMVRSGVLREIAGRFSGLIRFEPLDEETRAAVTARQIMTLGREYGLDIVSVSPEIARAFTPVGGLSVRSAVGMLEGALTPLFMTFSLRNESIPLYLGGTPEKVTLIPA